MAEPERDDGGVDSGVQQSHGAAVPQNVRVQLVRPDGRAAEGGGGSVLVDEALDGVAAEAPSGAGREQRLVGSPARSVIQTRSTAWVGVG